MQQLPARFLPEASKKLLHRLIALIERFYDLYFHGVTDFSGPRHQTEDSQVHLRRPDAGITMGVWDGIELGDAAQYSGM